MSLLSRPLSVRLEPLLFRQTLYQYAAVVVIVLIGLLFVLRESTGSATPFSRVMHTMLIGYCALLLASPAAWRQRLGSAMPYTFAGIALLIRVYVCYLVPVSPTSLSLLLGTFLCEPLIYVLLTCGHTPQRALRNTLGALAVLNLAVLPYVYTTWYDATLLSGPQLLLPLGTHGGLIAMLYIFAVLVTRFDEVTRTAERLEHLAHHDALTKLPNRRQMGYLLDQSISQAETKGSAFGVILIDVDHFKSLNDHYGHDLGDEVLRQLAVRLQSRLRVSDVLARWGGEEFILLAGRVSPGEIVKLAERLCTGLCGAPLLENHPHLAVTVSCGASVYVPGDTQNTLLKRADIALYEAKGAGRNCVRVRLPDAAQTSVQLAV